MKSSRSLFFRLWRSRWSRLLSLILVLLGVNVICATRILTQQFDRLNSALQAGEWPIRQGGRFITLKKASDGIEKIYRLAVFRNGRDYSLTLDVPSQEFSPLRMENSDQGMHLSSIPLQKTFAARDGDPAEIQLAIRELGSHLPSLDWRERILSVLVLRPLFTGVRWSKNGPLWKISTSHDVMWLGQDAFPEQANLTVGNWRVEISPLEKQFQSIDTAGFAQEEVPAEELVSSVAEVIRIVGTLVTPAAIKTSEIRRSGAGWLEIRDGHIQMYLTGSPYEIGLQHGRLDPDGVGKVCRRLVYGVGLLYSFKKGEWFPAAARKLVARQRAFIAPAYFEEMQGLADGSVLPLDLIQMANIFPEFFHCSGVALMGEATKDGELLHARVLDYMVGIGLQDHAAVMAISRPGTNRFVTVGYLGFIGSVTGMNEKQVAIGEMGGDGQGDWDGIPMSLLIRQALENCNTLEEVEKFMRESPRTCEYYYVISDGKGPSAVGVAATSKKFETFGPGVWHERLTDPLKDAVLLSGPGRYEALVERVRREYGKITPDNLIEIIKRPVAMKSNLHNVIFQPQSLRLSVADASRRGVACDEPYRNYTWNDLFSAAPSR